MRATKFKKKRGCYKAKLITLYIYNKYIYLFYKKIIIYQPYNIDIIITMQNILG